MHTSLGGRVVHLTHLTLLTVHRRDVDDTTPSAIDHAIDHLLGHVEHRIQVGVDHSVPRFTRHLAEHTVTRDACVINQNVDFANFLLYFFEGGDSAIPIGHVAFRGDEVITQRLLLGQPLVFTWRIRATACNNGKSVFGQSLTNSGSDTTHTTRYIGYALAHTSVSQFILVTP